MEQARSRFRGSGQDLGNVIPPERVICQDEMVESVDAEAFQQRLWGMFGVTFRCLLSLPQVDRVRWHLFPKIRVSQGTFDLGSPSAPKVETVPDIVRVMDLQQEQLARSMGEGHRVIHGVAGTHAWMDRPSAPAAERRMRSMRLARTGFQPARTEGASRAVQ